jgi:hypothetical protein
VTTRRSQITDTVIRWGLGLQLVFLVFLDWGTIAFMQRSGEVSTWHIVGLGVVNLLLVGGTMLLWGWVRRCQAAGSRVPTARVIATGSRPLP